MFRPVKTKRVCEEIVDQIKTLIIEGKLRPGDKLLSERELSERFNASRASVREAFRGLEMMGIIDIRPGEGSFIRQISYEGMLGPLPFLLQVGLDDILQLFEVRKILEVEAAALAADRATEDDLKEIEAAMAAMSAEVAAGNLGDTADTAFHLAVVKAANNPLLVKLMTTITDLMLSKFRTSRQRLFLNKDLVSKIEETHAAIFSAVRAGDSDLARDMIRGHLEMVEKAMLNLR